MNGLVIVLIGIVALAAGYLLYGRWLAKKWGIDPNAKTPAYTHEDGQDYVPSSKFTVFSHQFSSIAGAGPVTGPILASVFGWVPVLLWLIIGGLFFGAVQDFGALYASVKNEGKSMGMIIEKYIGKTGRKLFMLFCWLFTLLVIAAFTDMVAGTFNGVGLDSAGTAYANSAAASISMLFIVVAVIFGVIQKHVGKMNEWVKAVVAIALLVVMFAVGMKLPIYASKTAWIYIIMAYLFLASVLPMWLLMQPRDYMTTFMLLGMIIGAVVGVVVAHPQMQLNAFNGFNVNGSGLFPTLFVTIACGAVSGFHSLVSSGTSSKTVSNEKDMPMIGYGAMVVESLLGIVALVVVGAVAVGGTKPEGTPFAIFSSGVAGFLEKLGVPVQVATVFMTMCVSALALTSLDSVARIGRMSFQELFYGDSTDPEKMTPAQRVLTNKYFATVITLFFGYLLTLGGYNNIWPLFGSANQLLAAMVLIALAVFLKTTGRTGWTLYIPMFVMLAVTFTALVQKTIALVSNIAAHNATFLVDGLQLIVALLLMILGVLVAYSCLKKLFTTAKNSEQK
ncbi:carbon starvation protein A [Roseburia sp. OF03-24]|jgi:carbon starvation protein|uniref:carbon starvation CstA family protein n=1 Tax=Roseburia TaxID=841 RepID=UPI000E539F04|nr:MULTISPECIES: carbon starvation CstA family protein [Roseburia]RGX90251.1 carbon starvation protein A [Roseburia sp. OF03-24]RHF94418.1 carbon starvation protein A [Roseburia sp. AM23-20]UMY99854.1 carbon starvation protein A [Roseburia rectibacter]